MILCQRLFDGSGVDGGVWLAIANCNLGYRNDQTHVRFFNKNEETAEVVCHSPPGHI